MARLTAELIPGISGSDFTAEFTGNPNAQALERATEITVYSTGAGDIEVAATESPESGDWEDTGENAVNGVFTMVKAPVCRAIRVTGVAAADPAPVRILVRHGI